MNASLRTAVTLAIGAIALAGCTHRYLSQAQSTPPRGTAFDTALAQNYLKLAKIEYREGDQKDGDAYALRSIAAGQGQPTLPDDGRYRQLPKSSASEVTQGRQRLVAALDRNGRTTRPEVAAYAQASFDCWVEQLDEDTQPDHIAACREAFSKSLAQLEAPEPAPTPAPAAEREAPKPFLVFFDWNKYTLTPEARQVIADAAEKAKVSGVRLITVTGYTDRSGKPDYNLALSKKRAQAVAAELERLGIPGSAIERVGRGEENPLVPTPDGVREPQNRRAELVFPKMSASLDNTQAIGIEFVR